jgi:DNA-binding IclR family transcriptional regulator
LERADLVCEGVPFVERLRDEAGARTQLSVASYRSALPLVDEHFDDHGPARPQRAEKAPCHCSATGKVLLAFRGRWCESVLSRPLEAHTERSLVETHDVRRQLDEIRQRGYAIEDGEYIAALASIAAPVFDHNGEAVAALGVSVPAGRLEADAGRLAAMVVFAARGLSDALGFVPGAEAEDEGPPPSVLEMVPAARSYAA